MKLKLLAVAAAVAVAAPGNAATMIIDFESVSPGHTIGENSSPVGCGPACISQPGGAFGTPELFLTAKTQGLGPATIVNDPDPAVGNYLAVDRSVTFKAKRISLTELFVPNVQSIDVYSETGGSIRFGIFDVDRPQIAANQWTTINLNGRAGTVRLHGITGVDNIVYDPVIATVPEPATWAMTILGFGLVGGSLRRRGSYGRIVASMEGLKW